jgi:hypothetical protein
MIGGSTGRAGSKTSALANRAEHEHHVCRPLASEPNVRFRESYRSAARRHRAKGPNKNPQAGRDALNGM